MCEKHEKRPAEHKTNEARSKPAIREHFERSKEHSIDWENVKVLEREPRDFPREIVEAINIRTLNPKLGRNKELEFDPVWEKLLAIKGTRWLSENSYLMSLTSMTFDEVIHH